ncbi:MAG: hypothetical protein JWO38_1253 [Gemmataceae bacterium]|nr:hypothetical protein [Gemmataceae bacterium]
MRSRLPVKILLSSAEVEGVVAWWTVATDSLWQGHETIRRLHTQCDFRGSLLKGTHYGFAPDVDFMAIASAVARAADLMFAACPIAAQGCSEEVTYRLPTQPARRGRGKR